MMEQKKGGNVNVCMEEREKVKKNQLRSKEFNKTLNDKHTNK